MAVKRQSKSKEEHQASSLLSKVEKIRKQDPVFQKEDEIESLKDKFYKLLLKTKSRIESYYNFEIDYIRNEIKVLTRYIYENKYLEEDTSCMKSYVEELEKMGETIKVSISNLLNRIEIEQWKVCETNDTLELCECFYRVDEVNAIFNSLPSREK